MSDFKYLFAPTKIGSMEVPNRIVMAPHGLLGWAPGSDAHVGYFEARAKGGAGTMFIACNPVVPVDLYKGYFIELYDQASIPKLAKIVDVIHANGAKAIAQGVWFTGAPGYPQPSGEIPQTLWAENQGRSMTIGEIHQLVEHHANAAANAMAAGADGIDLPMAGGAGLQCLASPLYNKRTDEYGGDMAGRLKAIFEIIDAIRDRCGRDFVLGFQVNADESILGGPGLDEGVEMCRMLADTGKIDYLRVGARGQKPQATYFHYPSSYMPQGTNLYAAAAVREALGDKVTIISGGRVTTAEFAEQALAEGQCDMVAMARAFIADAEWPNKARRGDTEEIRACIGDIEGCFLRTCHAHAVGCTVNPDLQHEHEGPLAPAEKVKNVVVAGGGPAGMEAALYAARRGHKVTLLEKTDMLGGHVSLEAMLPGLGDRSDFVRWTDLQLKKLGVDVRLNTEATPELIKSLAPDAVVLATGASYARTGITPIHLMAIPGAESDYVLTPEDVLLAKKPVGQRVVVYDTTGYEVGPGLAEMFADQGKDVTIVTIDAELGRTVADLGIDAVIGMRLLPKAEFFANTSISEIADHTVTLTHRFTFEQSVIEDVDTVVLVTSRPPMDALFHDIVGTYDELHLVGDVKDSHSNVFGTDDAIKDGRRVGLLL